jgi:hypothetical protein
MAEETKGRLVKGKRWPLNFRELRLTRCEISNHKSYSREADRVKHEEKKRRNREAVRKHRQRRRAKGTTSVADSEEGSSRWHSPSVGVEVDAGENGIITTTSSHDSIEHPTQPPALLALADAAHKRSVSTQTDSFDLSSEVSARVTRSVAIQTSDFIHDYRLRKCIWPNDRTDSSSESPSPSMAAATSSTMSYR